MFDVLATIDVTRFMALDDASFTFSWGGGIFRIYIAMLSWTDSLRGVTANGHPNNEEQGGSKRQTPCRRHPVRDEEHFRQESGFIVAVTLKEWWENKRM